MLVTIETDLNNGDIGYKGAVMKRGRIWVPHCIKKIFKISLVFLFAFFVPKFFLHYLVQDYNVSNKVSFKLGLENVTAAFLKKLTPAGDLSYRVGLITNQTGKDQQGCSNIVCLRKLGVKIAAVFCPEHNFMPGVQERDIPIVTLYDKQGHRKLDDTLLANIDVLIFDIQDAGMRHYRYVTTLLNALQAAATYKKLLVVLDRPNLLGAPMEGFVQSNDQTIPIPVRYGMTVGELAHYLNTHIMKEQAPLQVVSMTNYDRKASNTETLVAHLSPNITNISSCHNYSFIGLIGEVNPFDIGVGTEKAFQCILLPESIKFPRKKWYELQVILKDMGVESTLYRHFSERKKEYCSGLRLFINDIDQFSSFGALVRVLQFFKETGLKLSFSKNFDTVLGTNQVRKLVEGKIEWCEFEGALNKELKLFFNKASGSFIYKPLPKLVML